MNLFHCIIWTLSHTHTHTTLLEQVLFAWLCPWLWVNKPYPLHHPRPHTLPPSIPPSAVWFPIGQLAVSILLCLCFHQHGTQTTLNFPLQAFTNTLLPLYCPEPSIMSLITIRSLYEQSGWQQVCRIRYIGSRPTTHGLTLCMLTFLYSVLRIYLMDPISKEHSCWSPKLNWWYE